MARMCGRWGEGRCEGVAVSGYVTGGLFGQPLAHVCVHTRVASTCPGTYTMFTLFVCAELLGMQCVKGCVPTYHVRTACVFGTGCQVLCLGPLLWWACGLGFVQMRRTNTWQMVSTLWLGVFDNVCTHM